MGVEKVGDKRKVETWVPGYEGRRSQVFTTPDPISIFENLDGHFEKLRA